jgi:hypothetical protein
MSEPIYLKNLLIAELRAGYRAGRFTPVQLAKAVLRRTDHAPERHVWITRLPRQSEFYRTITAYGQFPHRNHVVQMRSSASEPYPPTGVGLLLSMAAMPTMTAWLNSAATVARLCKTRFLPLTMCGTTPCGAPPTFLPHAP